MAKKKTRMLWLSRDTEFGREYTLWYNDPVFFVEEQAFRGGKAIRYFCLGVFNRLCPALKLRKNTKCKVKLTQLKNGIKLEKIAGKG